jgi:hypothetical protein
LQAPQFSFSAEGAVVVVDAPAIVAALEVVMSSHLTNPSSHVSAVALAYPMQMVLPSALGPTHGPTSVPKGHCDSEHSFCAAEAGELTQDVSINTATSALRRKLAARLLRCLITALPDLPLQRDVLKLNVGGRFSTGRITVHDSARQV